MRPSTRASAVTGSATLALAARAAELAASGVDVISMAVGEPDADAPASVQAAAHRAIESGKVRYTPAAGMRSLREQIARYLASTRQVTMQPSEIVVCHSAKHGLSHALLALVDPGDEVLLLDPVWNSYEEQVRIAGGVPLHVPPGPGCVPDLAAIERAVTPRTRGIMFNSPSNPSGYVWDRAQIEELVDIATRRDLWILSDEIYARLVFDDAVHVSPAAISDEGRARTVIVDGASKCFAMTGYRIGYVAGPQDVVDAVERLQSQVSGCPNYVSQCAYEAGLSQEPPEVADMCASFDARRRIVVEGLEALGLTLPRPRGAFYAFPDVTAHLDDRGAAGFCEDLLEAESLVLVPGTVFSGEGHVRLSYALPEDRIREALDRLGRFLAAKS